MAGRRWIEEELEYLYSQYPHRGLRKTAQVLGRTQQAVEAQAKRRGIKSLVRSALTVQTRASKSVDLTYFAQIKGYNKGYVLGFILADGSMERHGLCIAVEVHNKDAEVLKFIKSELKLTASINHREARPMCSITIPTKEMTEQFRKLGVHLNKSRTVQLHNIYKNGDWEFRRGIVSGYFDGDGCAGLDLRKKSPLILSFKSNSFKMLQDVSEQISAATGLPLHHISHNKLAYYCQQAVKLAEWIYKIKKEFHLDRKHQICSMYMEGEI